MWSIDIKPIRRSREQKYERCYTIVSSHTMRHGSCKTEGNYVIPSPSANKFWNNNTFRKTMINLFICRISATRKAQHTTCAINRGLYFNLSKKCKLSQHLHFGSCVMIMQKQNLGKPKITHFTFQQYHAETFCFYLCKRTISKHSFHVTQKFEYFLWYVHYDRQRDQTIY